jgi:hypothetical protein
VCMMAALHYCTLVSYKKKCPLAATAASIMRTMHQSSATNA